MIGLFLTALDSQANYREFSCWLYSIEDQFEVLNNIVAQGGTLLSAYLEEDAIRTNLPVHAFDGLSATVNIQSLERVWKSQLKPAKHSRTHQQRELIELTRQRIGQYQIKIVTYEQMIDWFGTWLQHTKDEVLSEPRRSRLIHHYENQLSLYQFQLIKAQASASQATNRLDQLLA